MKGYMKALKGSNNATSVTKAFDCVHWIAVDTHIIMTLKVLNEPLKDVLCTQEGKYTLV